VGNNAHPTISLADYPLVERTGEMPVKNIWGKLRNLQDSGLLDGALSAGGKLIYLDGALGSDSADGSFDHPVKTLTAAYALARDGKHDVIVIKNSGVSAALCTVRVDAAFVWSKNCLHLMSLSPTRPMFSQRARLAPTGATTAFANFISMSGSDCVWDGIQLWHGFDTGGANAIALTLTGSRNRFTRCHIAGMADTASAHDAGSRCVKFSGGGEHLFEECVIGVDTVDRDAANATIEFAGGTARNVFNNCVFPIRATATSPLLVKAAAAAASDRFQLFKNCVITNHGASSLKLCTLAASIGGFIGFVDCRTLGVFGGYGTDATSLGQIYITGPTDGSTLAGKGYAPNA
jgi:hypothetical protein